MKLNLSKELAISAGIGVIIGILVLSYAANNNLNKIRDLDSGSPVYDLAQEIISAYDNEIVTNKGIANSLASKVMAANKAIDKGDTETAVQKLNELIAQVTDQTGNHIPEGEAGVLIGLAEGVIADLSGVTTPETIVCTNSDGQTYTLDRTCVEVWCRDSSEIHECIETNGLCNDRSECLI